ncbi:MAG: hypothetical protein INR62_07470 [Rhodospirillales bacterium]|nr:hypothetical protein [Acetobacter sp.]
MLRRFENTERYEKAGDADEGASTGSTERDVALDGCASLRAAFVRAMSLFVTDTDAENARGVEGVDGEAGECSKDQRSQRG